MPRQKYCVANWKMNFTISNSVEFIHNWKNKVLNNNIKIIFCPSFTALKSVSELIQNHNSSLGAQNLYFEKSGAYTGEISGEMLQEAGCEYVIIGHSERRHILGESSRDINLKLLNALDLDLTPILCVGETLEERNDGKTEKVLTDQLELALAGIEKKNEIPFLIAYEPVWAIGTGLAATEKLIMEAHQLIRNNLKEIGFNGESISILYGGSVSDKNISGIAAISDVDGCLIGGVSLDVEKFYNIYQTL